MRLPSTGEWLSMDAPEPNVSAPIMTPWFWSWMPRSARMFWMFMAPKGTQSATEIDHQHTEVGGAHAGDARRFTEGFGLAVGELLTPFVAEAGEPLEVEVGWDMKVVQLAKAVGHVLLFCDVAFVFDLSSTCSVTSGATESHKAATEGTCLTMLSNVT